MNLVDGMDHANGTKTAAMLTVTASSAVVTDTEVMIMRDGASTASADDYGPVESVMIMAGGKTGTTEVMAVEDDMAEDMEMLILYGMVDGMNTTSVMLLSHGHDAGPGPAAHRATSAGGLPGHRRIPPLSEAVTFGSAAAFVVSHTPSPPTPRGGGGFFFTAGAKSRFTGSPGIGPRPRILTHGEQS